MPCLGCQSCELETVTLHDGRNVCKFCPDWRAECEAKELLRMPLEARRAQLEAIARKRGAEACAELKELMTAIFNSKKGGK